MNAQKAFARFRENNTLRLYDMVYHPVGEIYGVIAYRYKRMDPPDSSVYYLPVRLKINTEGFDELTEITKDFDYAVVLSVAYSKGRQGYAPSVRRLLLEE